MEKPRLRMEFLQHAFGESGDGHRLNVVGDGQEAKDYLLGAGLYKDRRKFPIPRVILLDIKMP